MIDLLIRCDTASVEAIEKAVYRLSPRAKIILGPDQGDSMYHCSVSSKLEDQGEEGLAEEFRVLVNDYHLRELIGDKTEALRALLYAQAFPGVSDPALLTDE